MVDLLFGYEVGCGWVDVRCVLFVFGWCGYVVV